MQSRMHKRHVAGGAAITTEPFSHCRGNMNRKYKNMQERILANSVESETHSFCGVPCRDWTGSVFPRTDWPDAPREQKYGRISVRFKRGPRRGHVKSTGAHRESLKAFKNRILSSKSHACHLCDRPICVEPAHLFGGTAKKNVKQAIQNGNHKTPFRRSNGERYTADRAS